MHVCDYVFSCSHATNTRGLHWHNSCGDLRRKVIFQRRKKMPLLPSVKQSILLPFSLIPMLY